MASDKAKDIASRERWWLVRAGERGVAFKKFSAESMIAAGSATPSVDLSGLDSPQAITAQLWGADPAFESWRCGEVIQFCLEMQEGDVVVTPDSGSTRVVLRVVDGPVRFCPKDSHGLRHQRRVVPGLSRTLSESDRKLLPSSRSGTVFRLDDHQRELLVRYLLEGS